LPSHPTQVGTCQPGALKAIFYSKYSSIKMKLKLTCNIELWLLCQVKVYFAYKYLYLMVKVTLSIPFKPFIIEISVKGLEARYSCKSGLPLVKWKVT